MEQTKVHPLGRNIFVTVQDFKGRKVVHIRRYDEDNARPGILFPTKTEICLTEGEYEKLEGFIEIVNEDLKKIKEKTSVPTKKRKTTAPPNLPVLNPAQGAENKSTFEMRNWTDNATDSQELF